MTELIGVIIIPTLLLMFGSYLSGRYFERKEYRWAFVHMTLSLLFIFLIVMAITAWLIAEVFLN